MRFRPYNPERDRDAVKRIWREVGWLEEEHDEMFDLFVSSGKAVVADIEGSAECAVITQPGTIRYLEEDLPFSIVGAVTTSLIARKQGLASRLTAQAVASDAADGALVSGLGMFEQGYYNRLGFGTGSYVHEVAFDPADLTVDVKPRVPRRITKDDWEAVHASRTARDRGHGACNVTSPDMTRSEMVGDKKAFGLGYYDGPDGELTHHIWIRTDNAESGPYHVKWAVRQTGDQFLELMAVLKSIGDQVHLINMTEPPGIQLPDLLRQPLTSQHVSRQSKFETRNVAWAGWQVRILDLPGCLARTHLHCGEVRFNLRLDDPVETLLDKASAWRGVAGDYVVTLGQESGAAPGSVASLPTLTASVGAFTRMWLGVRPASGLAVTDRLSGPDELLRGLDRALMLPTPHLGWDI